VPHYFRTLHPTSLEKTANAFRRILKPFPFAGADGLSVAPAPILEASQSSAAMPTESSAPLFDASSLVASAASILNEDMAAGVLAARQVRSEGTLQQKPSSAPGPNFKQLLRDAHDFVDAISSVLPKLQGGAKDWLGTTQSHAYTSRDITQLESKVVRAGDIARVTIKLQNDNAEIVRLIPYCTTLIGDSGYRIAEENLAFTPREVRLEVDEIANLTLDVHTPNECPKGKYAGIIKVTGATYLCAVVSIEVV
jgi:hypothetical protein